MKWRGVIEFEIDAHEWDDAQQVLDAIRKTASVVTTEIRGGATIRQLVVGTKLELKRPTNWGGN